MLTSVDTYNYIIQMCKLIGVKDPTAIIEYVNSNDLRSFLERPEALLKGVTLKKMNMFLDLHKQSYLLKSLSKTLTNSPELVADFARTIIDDSMAQESLIAIFVNTKNEVVGYDTVSKGTDNSMLIDPKSLFRNALLHKASAFFLVHNHPSGHLDPSEHDITSTKKMLDAGALLGMPGHDHLIIDGISNRFYSMRREYPGMQWAGGGNIRVSFDR